MNPIRLFLVMSALGAFPVSADTGVQMDSVLVDVIRENYYRAMVRCEDVLKADSTVAEAHRYLGWLHIATRQSDLKESRDYLKRAVALNPKDAGAQSDLGFVLAFQQNYAPALEAFQKAVALEPEETFYRRNLGFLAEKGGHFKIAEEAFRKVIDQDPVDDLAAYGYGLALSRLGRYEEALAAYRRAARIFPERKEAFSGIGQILMMRGDYAGAAAVLERAKQIDFEDPKPHYALAQAYRQMGDSLASRQAWETFRYFDEQHRYEGRDRYILPVEFDHLARLLNRGSAFARLGRHDEALKIFEDCQALAEDSASPYRFSAYVPLIHLAAGASHQAIGNVNEARRFYDAARTLGDGGPVSDEALAHLADLFLFTEGLSEAEVRGYERITAMDPSGHAAFWIYDQMSQAHLKAGRLASCIAAYEEMMNRTNFFSMGLMVRLAVAYAAAGRIEEAAALYREAFQGVEDASHLYQQLSVLYRRTGLDAKADSMAVKAKAGS